MNLMKVRFAERTIIDGVFYNAGEGAALRPDQTAALLAIGRLTFIPEEAGMIPHKPSQEKAPAAPPANKMVTGTKTERKDERREGAR